MLAKLIAGSDVLVENFRPGVLAEMGFDEARLKALKPDLVFATSAASATPAPIATGRRSISSPRR